MRGEIIFFHDIGYGFVSRDDGGHDLFLAAYTIALKPKRWRFERRSGGERIAAFAMKYIQPFRSRLLDAVPIHYLLAFRAIGVRNYC
jgi:hypothetical protein